MKLYYVFGTCDHQDYEFEVPDEVIIAYLKSITLFEEEEIKQHLPLFEKLFSEQIYSRFQKKAYSHFMATPNIGNRQLVSFLCKKETSKKQRQAFLKREALKKKGMVE